MKIEREDEGDVAILELSGKVVGGDDGGVLRAAVAGLVEGGTTKVLLDLSGVPWMNSYGVGILVQAYTTLHNGGARVKFLNLNERVRAILGLTKLLKVFETYTSREDALAGFRGPSSP